MKHTMKSQMTTDGITGNVNTGLTFTGEELQAHVDVWFENVRTTDGWEIVENEIGTFTIAMGTSNVLKVWWEDIPEDGDFDYDELFATWEALDAEVEANALKAESRQADPDFN